VRIISCKKSYREKREGSAGNSNPRERGSPENTSVTQQVADALCETAGFAGRRWDRSEVSRNTGASWTAVGIEGWNRREEEEEERETGSLSL
jgi:hypothetical protein